MNGQAVESLVVGAITGCHGVKGWVKVKAFTEPQENLFRLGPWTIDRRIGGTRDTRTVEFDAFRPQGKGMVAHMVGVDDRTLAETYRGAQITVPADRLPTLTEGDYYWHQLQGLQVWSTPPTAEGERQLLGEVDYLIETGANDVLVVKPSTDSIDQRERLIPYLPGDVVTAVDLEQGVIEVEWFPED